MNLKPLAFVAVLGLAALSLTSCGSTGPADVVNPTITQMDALDAQWGLPKRTNRSAPRRFDSSSYTPSASAAAPARSTSGAAASTPAAAPASAPAAAPANSGAPVDPNVIKSLR